MRAGLIIAAWVGYLCASIALAAQDMRPLPRPDTGISSAEPVVEMSLTEANVSLASPLSPIPRARPEDLLRGHEVRLALAAARQGDWDRAGRIAAGGGGVAADIIEWERLRAGKGTFADYRAFLASNGDWPGLKRLRRRGEASIAEGASPEQVIAYFKPEPPQTGYGVLQLAWAHERSGNRAKAHSIISEAWKRLAMSARDENAIIAAYGSVVGKHHEARLDDALWRKDAKAARRMLSRVGSGAKSLAEVRLALQARARSVDGKIKALPAALQRDPGLARDRFEWRIAKRQRDGAMELLVEQSGTAESLGRPEAWADWRRVLSRQAMRGGNYRLAYNMASRHRMSEGSDFADLEWLSGYLALRFLQKPGDALKHFERFRGAVFTPISLGRAGYWEGRALEALGRNDAAREAYAEGAKYQTSFYGQLAAEKLNRSDDALSGKLGIEAWRGRGFAASEVFEAASLMFDAGRVWEASWYLRHLAETTPEADLVPLTDYALSLGDAFVAVRVAKQAAAEGVVAPRAYYPLTALTGGDLPVPRELALSIARQESEFYAAAVSHAGARGIMQVMPKTARSMANKLNLPYSQSMLTADPVYNATLGSAYLEQLIDEFGNNVLLVAAGYNAGPSRSRRWIANFGDPRTRGVDAVDWIEHIPFRETRNYVMRVAEGLHVYRARLSGTVPPLQLSAELKAR